MAMDDRKQRVLDAIVVLYGSGGEPVGSGLLATYFDRAVSSATLRNEMAALTKLGLLEQPHTSAGRVPSAKGYRNYVDRLLAQGIAPLAQAERDSIDAAFAAMDMEPDHLAQSAARSLAEMTGFAAAATTPRADDSGVAHFELVQVGKSAVAVLAVTNAGGVRTRVARTEGNLVRSDISALEQLLNRSLTFLSPADLTEYRQAELLQMTPENMVSIVQAAMLLLIAQPRVYLEGAQNLVKWQGTRESLADLLELFAEERQAQSLIAPVGNRLTVTFGSDLAAPMPGVCVASKRYLAGGGQTGTLAVIGPSRMDFRRLIPLLDYCTLKLGQCMAGNG